jgi:hypothetical protein
MAHSVTTNSFWNMPDIASGSTNTDADEHLRMGNMIATRDPRLPDLLAG